MDKDSGEDDDATRTDGGNGLDQQERGSVAPAEVNLSAELVPGLFGQEITDYSLSGCSGTRMLGKTQICKLSLFGGFHSFFVFAVPSLSSTRSSLVTFWFLLSCVSLVGTRQTMTRVHPMGFLFVTHTQTTTWDVIRCVSCVAGGGGGVVQATGPAGLPEVEPDRRRRPETCWFTNWVHTHEGHL